MRPRRTLLGTVIVDGTAFNWRLVREPQWCSDRWKGLVISAELADDPCRKLILEFPFEIKSHSSTPQRQRPSISEKHIELHLRAALAAGWDPKSRGKAFVLNTSAS